MIVGEYTYDGRKVTSTNKFKKALKKFKNEKLKVYDYENFEKLLQHKSGKTFKDYLELDIDFYLDKK